MNAIPSPDVERHFVADRTTRRARLGTRIPTVALDERLSGACGFVFEESREHAPSRVGRSFRKGVVLHDPLHMQVFNHDNLVFVDDAARQLVKMVLPGARNALMHASYQLPGFVPARSFLLAREFALFAFQVSLRLTQMAGIGELRSVAGYGEVCQADVNANRFSIRRDGEHWFTVVGQDGGMKLATCVAADRDGLELSDDLPVDNAFDPANLWQIDARAFDLHALRILNRLTTVPGLEAGVFATFCEKVLVCACKILQRLLQRLAVRVTKPLELLFQLRKPDRHRMIVQAFARGAIEIARQGECVVPRPPRATELNSQGMSLFIGRIEADTGCSEHPLDIRYLCLKSKWPYIPALNGGVLRPKRINSCMGVALPVYRVVHSGLRKNDPRESSSH
jgi:hypothetical protein